MGKNYSLKQCKYSKCNREFAPGSPNSKFCSYVCYRKDYVENGYARKDIDLSRLCLGCGERFAANHPTNFYCTHECFYAKRQNTKSVDWHNKHDKRVCKWCGGEIPKSKVNNQKPFCTEFCWRVYRQRERVLAYKVRHPRGDKYKTCYLCGGQYLSDTCSKYCEICKVGVYKEIKRRKVAKRGGFLPDDFTEVFWKVRNERTPCAICGGPYTEDFEIDHIIPLAEAAIIGFDRPNKAGNLQPLCKSCHRAKTSIDISRIAGIKRGLKLCKSLT